MLAAFSIYLLGVQASPSTATVTSDTGYIRWKEQGFKGRHWRITSTPLWHSVLARKTTSSVNPNCDTGGYGWRWVFRKVDPEGGILALLT